MTTDDHLQLARLDLGCRPQHFRLKSEWPTRTLTHAYREIFIFFFPFLFIIWIELCNLRCWTVTQGFMLVNVLSSPCVFSVAGKRASSILARMWNNGADSMSRTLPFPFHWGGLARIRGLFWEPTIIFWRKALFLLRPVGFGKNKVVGNGGGGASVSVSACLGFSAGPPGRFVEPYF